MPSGTSTGVSGVDVDVVVPDPDVRFPGWPFVGGGSQGDDDGGGGDGAGDGAGAGSSDDPGNVGGEGGAGGEDDGEGGEPTDPQSILEQAAADFDDEALEGAQTQDDDEGDGGGASDRGEGQRGRGTGKPTSFSPLKDFIEKNYGGDESAFVASLHESRKEARRLADEVAVLKHHATSGAGGKGDAGAELEAALKSDTEVQTLDQRIKSIGTADQRIAARQLEIVERAQKLRSAIDTTAAELPHIEDHKEWSKKFAALSDARTELAQLNGEYVNNETRQELLADRHAAAQRALAKRKAAIKADMDEREDRERSTANNVKRVQTTFANAFDSLAKPYRLDTKSDRYIVMRESVRTLLADHLESLGDEEDGLDSAGIYAAVSKLIARYATANGMKPVKGAGTGRGAGQGSPESRTRVSGGTVPPRRVVVPGRVGGGVGARDGGSGNGNDGGARTRPPVPRTREELYDDPEFVRKRADHVFTKLQREQGRRTG